MAQELQDKPVTPHRGYYRRTCSECGYELGFSESNPCETCSLEIEFPSKKGKRNVPSTQSR